MSGQPASQLRQLNHPWPTWEQCFWILPLRRNLPANTEVCVSAQTDRWESCQNCGHNKKPVSLSKPHWWSSVLLPETSFCLFIEWMQQGWPYFAVPGWCGSPPFLFPICVPVSFVTEMPVALSCDLCASWCPFTLVSFVLTCCGTSLSLPVSWHLP